MTVKELIEMLKDCDENAIVFTTDANGFYTDNVIDIMTDDDDNECVIIRKRG